jgi:hyperosmotically inducible protein
MNIRFQPLVLGLAIAAGLTILVSGCNREQAVPVVSAPPATTVGTDIDDTVVTTKVKSALLADDDVKGFDIKVETRKGMVMLSGFVDNQTQIDRALTVARGVEGVKGIENSMTVKDAQPTVGNQVDDTIVTGRVKTALLADDVVKSADIAVATNRGEVQLSGFVNNQAQIDRALVVARAAEGVQGVVNEMSIKK